MRVSNYLKESHSVVLHASYTRTSTVWAIESTLQDFNDFPPSGGPALPFLFTHGFLFTFSHLSYGYRCNGSASPFPLSHRQVYIPKQVDSLAAGRGRILPVN